MTSPLRSPRAGALLAPTALLAVLAILLGGLALAPAGPAGAQVRH